MAICQLLTTIVKTKLKMCEFETIPKKLAIPLFVLFEIGWVAYLAGFGLTLDREKEGLPETSSLLLPCYLVVIGGQFVVVFGLLQAGLPFGTTRSIVGVLSTALNTTYFVFVGFVMVSSKFHTLAVSVNDSRLMLDGTIIQTTSWGLVQILSMFYDPQQQQTRRLLCTCTSVSQCSTWRHVVCTEVVRLLSILIIFLSAVGWIVSISGIRSITDIDVEAHHFMKWSALFVSPVLYLSALLHAGCSGRASIAMQFFATILNTFFTVSMGYVVISSGLFIYQYPTSRRAKWLQLNGAVLSLFLWTVVLAMWPFYHLRRDYTHTSHSCPDRHQIKMI